MNPAIISSPIGNIMGGTTVANDDVRLHAVFS